MRFGLGTLGLSPKQFWSMTVRELNAAIEAYSGAADHSPDRDWFKQVMRQFPDK